MPPKATPKAKPKPKIKIKVKKLSKKQLENKAKDCFKSLEATYQIIAAKFNAIIKGCTDGKDKEKLKKDLYETIHNISILLSKAVPLELRNSPNDRSKQLKDLLNTWIKDSSSTKNKVKSISYTSIIKSFIETCLTPEGKLRFSRTKKNSDSLYRALDARNIINPTADDKQCDIAFDTDQWPATHKCYICGLCLHNMQSYNCGAPCEHLLNIYQVMITFGFIETEDKRTIDINKDDRKNIYAPSCTCCNSEKSNIEIISFKNNKWQVNEKNVEKILKQVKDSKRECCYKNGHPDEPEKPGDRDDQAVWVKPSKKDNDKCSTTNVAFPGKTETRPLYDYSDTAINNRKKEIINMLKRRVDVLNAKVPRPKATSNLPYLNAIIQIATFFTHISLNAYRKMAMEMVGRTAMAGRTDGGAPPAAGAGDDNIYELCSDADADCFDIEVYENKFKKEFENHFWEEFEIGVNDTTFDDTSTTEANINLLISTLSTNNTEIINISNNDIQIVYNNLLAEDNTKQEGVEKKKKDSQVNTAIHLKNKMLKELPTPEDSVETDTSGSPVIPIAHATESNNMSPPSSDTEDPNSSQDYSSDNSQLTYGDSSDSQGMDTQDIKPIDNSSDSQPDGFSSGDDESGPIRQKPKFVINVPSNKERSNTFADDAEVSSYMDMEQPNLKSPRLSREGTPGSVEGRTSSTLGFDNLSFGSRPNTPGSRPNTPGSRPNTPGFRKTGSTHTLTKARPSIPADRSNMWGGKKTRKNKTKKQNKTRKQKPKKQTKRISYVKNKQTRKNKKRIKKSNSKKAT